LNTILLNIGFSYTLVNPQKTKQKGVLKWDFLKASRGDVSSDGQYTNVLNLTFQVAYFFSGGPLPIKGT